MAKPFMGMLDQQAKTLSFWGDGETPIDMTSMDDTAAFLAEIVRDPGMLNEIARVAGDELSMPEIAAAYQQATGQALTLRSRGTIEQGYAELERLKAERADLMRMLPLMYQLPMMSGKAELKHVKNDRYPRVRPTRLAQFLQLQSR